MLSQLDETIDSLLDEAFDPVISCTGDLSDWLNGSGSSLRVVTGKPGAGKSALLGVLVRAAHPVLRGEMEKLWWRLPHKPAENRRLAVVHARRRSLAEIADSLAWQMGGASRPPGRVLPASRGRSLAGADRTVLDFGTSRFSRLWGPRTRQLVRPGRARFRAGEPS